MSEKNQPVDGRPPENGATTKPAHGREKRRLMVTQILRSPVLNPAGVELGRLEDLIVKLDSGGFPPPTGNQGPHGGAGGFVSNQKNGKIAPPPVPPHTPRLHSRGFSRRPRPQ